MAEWAAAQRVARGGEGVARIADVVRCLDAACPVAWAEAWDNVGLLAGDPAADVARCVCALDADARSLDLAAAVGAQLLVVHHPLPFRPVGRLVSNDPAGSFLWRAAGMGLALYAAHTNFDVHPEGVNRALAEALGLRAPRPLRVTGRETLYKLVVYVPAGYEARLRDALFRAGAGQLGRYSQCSFAGRGEGTFLPLEGARPFAGQVGVRHHQPESRLEVLVAERGRVHVLEALRAAHPYEDIAYDLLRLENDGPARALGLVGAPARQGRLDRFAAMVAKRLRSPVTRYVGEPGWPVRSVAVCGGAGSDLVADALGAGADVLVTADVRYHQAREAEARGLALVDPGHQATEAPAIPRLAALVRRAVTEGGLDVQVDILPDSPDVWRSVVGRQAAPLAGPQAKG